MTGIPAQPGETKTAKTTREDNNAKVIAAVGAANGGKASLFNMDDNGWY